MRSHLAAFVDHLAGVIERLVGLPLEAHAKGLLVFLAGGLCRRPLPPPLPAARATGRTAQCSSAAQAVIDAAIGSVDVVAFLMRAHAIGLRHHGRGGKDAQVLALCVQVQHRRIVGTGLIAPLRVGDDGVVVVDKLPAHAQAEPVLVRRADLGVSQLQIPANRIRRADRRVLKARTGVLHLRRNPQPTGCMQIHLEPEAIQNVSSHRPSL